MEKVTIQKFKAFTGKLFDSSTECTKYEKLIRKINKIMKNLRPIPDTTKFMSGKGYIQQENRGVEIARKEILELGRTLYKEPKLSFGWMGRYCDDSGPRELYHAWGRLSHIDNQYREWGQGYFAINPDKGTQEEYSPQK